MGIHNINFHVEIRKISIFFGQKKKQEDQDGPVLLRYIGLSIQEKIFKMVAMAAILDFPSEQF